VGALRACDLTAERDSPRGESALAATYMSHSRATVPRMSGTALSWVLAVHVLGTFVWIGCLFALTQVLRAHEAAGPAASAAFSGLERRGALVMDIGALLAIGAAVLYLLATRSHGEAWALKQGWLHAKLTGVLVLLGVHGFVRARVGRAARGEPFGVPRALHPILGLLLVAIVVLVVVKPF
jgi:protoporphyrinogen IX oxidase